MVMSLVTEKMLQPGLGLLLQRGHQHRLILLCRVQRGASACIDGFFFANTLF